MQELVLAAGYLHQPEKTAEVFVPHLFKPDQKMYRTGDLVRLLPNGVIEFVGRKDSQIKVRGFRIELGEIETVLSNHPIIQESVVIAKKMSDDYKPFICLLHSGKWYTTRGTSFKRLLKQFFTRLYGT
ncbi:hypothetical protein AABM34_22210 [Lysinibacillus fusiformis]